MNHAATQPAWGEHTLSLQLPSVSLSLDGLSTGQYQALQAGYSRFIERDPQANANSNRLSCTAYRLANYPEIDSGALTRDQQYAPLTTRDSDSLGLVGCNFRARLPLFASASPGSVGVLHETELAQPNVIENLMRVLSAHTALHQGGVILHSAGLVFGGRAYIFIGRSNVGKTTLTRKAHRQGATVLSDDINLLLPEGAGYLAHAVPFTGEFGRTLAHTGGRGAFPVAALILLEQGATLRTLPVAPSSAVAKLLVGSPFVNADVEASAMLLQVLSDLQARLPVLRLQTTRKDDIGAIMACIENHLTHG